MSMRIDLQVLSSFDFIITTSADRDRDRDSDSDRGRGNERAGWSGRGCCGWKPPCLSFALSTRPSSSLLEALALFQRFLYLVDRINLAALVAICATATVSTHCVHILSACGQYTYYAAAVSVHSILAMRSERGAQ